MFDFNKPNIEITEISEDKKSGRFVVEPLERGYGTTLGNSLRRIMLSSLPLKSAGKILPLSAKARILLNVAITRCCSKNRTRCRVTLSM